MMKKMINRGFALLTAAILTVPALADVIDIPPDNPATSSSAPVLVIGVVVIAAAILAVTIVRRRKQK